MKILAYGGNEYSIRAMIGEWPGISVEHLGDLYGIPSGSPSFGLVFPAGSPALLYRERINPQYRGGYPYTVLLDLGPWDGADTLWGRASWNAAGLLECMFGTQSPRRSIFMAPEHLSTAALHSVIEEILAKHELDRFAQQPTAPAAFEKNWASFLAGSLDSSVPVVAPPQALGMEQRPTMAELANLSFRLPPWLRTGRGWMVGGSYTQAAGFGAGALLDDELFGEKIDPSQVIRDGDQLQSLFQQLTENSATAVLARELINQPAFRWPDSKQFFDHARLWRQVVDGDDSAFQEDLPQDGMFAAEIFGAAFENAMDKARSQTRIGPNQTRAILELRHRFGPTRIPRAMVPFLDVNALSRQLDTESVPPRVPEYLELPPDLCLALSKRQMMAKKRNLTPADLGSLRQFLRDTGSADVESDFLHDFVRQLPWLAPWKNSEDRKLHQILKDEAASRLDKGTGNIFRTWLYDAATFLPAEQVNVELERFKDSLDASLKDLVLQLEEEPRQMGVQARAWIKQLALSGLRDHIGAEAKLAIAFESPQGWTDFWSLSQALKDGKPFAAREVPREQRATLAKECVDLLRLYSRSNQLHISVPEFVQIVKQLELQKRFPTALRALAADPQSRRYYEALPAQKKGAPSPSKLELLNSEKDRAASPQLLTEASRVRHAIDQVLNEIADFDATIAPQPRRGGDSEAYDDLADLLLIDWVCGKSPQRNSQEQYAQLPLNFVAILTGIAGLLLGATAWVLPVVVHVGAAALGQFRLPLELTATTIAILGLAQLIRGLFPPTYTLNLSGRTWKRVRKVVTNLVADGNPHTEHRCRELIENIAQAGTQNFNVSSSFDWILLLFLGSEPEAIDRCAQAGSTKRVRRAILSALDSAGLIQRKGWFRG